MKTRTLPRAHAAGRADCWCRPGVVETPAEIRILHRDKIGVVFDLHPYIGVWPKAEQQA